MIPGPPTDAEVVQSLEEGLCRRGDRASVAAIERTPYAYATSFPLEEVFVRLADGRTLHLILKDLTWERLLGDASRTKPRFLYEPRRGIQTYEKILAGSGMGAACYGAFVADGCRRAWLLIERVPGVELWQVGDFAVWKSVARWLARFHRAFADGDGVAHRNPYLLRYDGEYFRRWARRALDQHRSLERIAFRYQEVVATLTAWPTSFIHGELYPSNVLVDGTGIDVRVWPIDWEMAGVGPCLLDLAALSAGWPEPDQQKLVAAYLDELSPLPAGEVDGEGLARLVDCCRLHYAMQWLGWAPSWSPPMGQSHDWLEEALALGERLGL